MRFPFRFPLFCLLILAVLFTGASTAMADDPTLESDEASLELSPALEATDASQFTSCGGLAQQAEAGAIAGRFVVALDASASGGAYMHVPNGSGSQGELGSSSRVTYCFNVSTVGTYHIRARTYAANSEDNSFFVTIDGVPTAGYLWELPVGSFRDEYISHRGAAGPVTVNLSTGQHVVRIYLREDGARLDTISLIPARRIYWGAYVRNAPWNMADLDAFNAVTGKAPAILHFGYPWKQSGQMKSFPTAVMNQIRQRGSIPLIGWGSWDASKGPEQPEFQLRDITEGHYDSYIREWAQQAKAWEHPFFLKFNWEMDGRWQFPWSVQLNGNTTGDFVPAWRHVHDIFEQEGATNVTWVWCPNHLNRNSVDPALVYPGDAYVDWTCIHGYNFGGSNWRTFREIYSGYDGNPRDSYTYMLNLAPSKPIMIGEWASNEAGDGGAAKAAWIRDALQVQLPRYYPQIRAVVWMNWNCCGESWVVNSSEPARQAIFESLASPFYASNQYGQLGTSPIPPPN
jgi:beta-mannanase